MGVATALLCTWKFLCKSDGIDGAVGRSLSFGDCLGLGEPVQAARQTSAKSIVGGK